MKPSGKTQARKKHRVQTRQTRNSLLRLPGPTRQTPAERNIGHQLKQTLIRILKQALTERNTRFSSDIHQLVIPERHLKRNF